MLHATVNLKGFVENRNNLERTVRQLLLKDEKREERSKETAQMTDKYAALCFMKKTTV
jgi:predicted component of type VI protein secretion system